MSIIRFIDADNQVTEVASELNETVMTVAVNNMIEGIIGECGGSMSCATCHCYVEDKYTHHFGNIGEMEEDMLSMVEHRQPNSRLGCQLELTENTGDIEIHLPPQV